MVKFLATLLSLFQLQAPVTAPPYASFSEASLLSVNVPSEKNQENIAPIVKAKAALVLDMDLHEILYAKDIDDRLPIASLTKLMTALVITDELLPDATVTVTSEAFTYRQKGSVTVGLKEGDTFDAISLLHASLIRSANDATAALAVANAGSLDAFVAKMNARAQSLGLKDTHFANPVGFDHPDNYSTAYELAVIAKQAFRRPIIREIMTKDSFSLFDVSGKSYGTFSNTNDLLDSYLSILGGKTGTTPEAGQCLFFVVETPGEHEVLVILLNSPQRYQEAKAVTDWVFRTYRWADIP